MSDAAKSPDTDRIKYKYHRLYTGHSVSFGYTIPADKNIGGKVKLAFAFGSPKDSFSKKTAKKYIDPILNSEKAIVLEQHPNGLHVMDLIGKFINSKKFFDLMPPSWKRKFPHGFRQRTSTDLYAVHQHGEDVYETNYSGVDWRIHKEDWTPRKFPKPENAKTEIIVKKVATAAAADISADDV